MTNPVVFGNSLALEADRHEHTKGMLDTPDAPGPCSASRALALCHIAMADVCSLLGANYKPWLKHNNPDSGIIISKNAAIAAAAYGVISKIYINPVNSNTINNYNEYIDTLKHEQGIQEGQKFGFKIADDVLNQRKDDPLPSDMSKDYYNNPDKLSYKIHNIDPFHEDRKYYGEKWGDIKTSFGMASVTEVNVKDYTKIIPYDIEKSIDQVKRFGSYESSERSEEQKEIGIFWSYDGSHGIGTPPRLYNQFILAVAMHDGRDNEIDDLARLFALANIAMADAGIVAWRAKYEYNIARPARWLNEGKLDNDGKLIPDRAPFWEPLGAQASYAPIDQPALTNNASIPSDVFGSLLASEVGSRRMHFTPPFPAYPSGHATFGTAAFEILKLWRNVPDKNHLNMKFQSDEFNGKTMDTNEAEKPRAIKERTFQTIDQAIKENNESRIWLGVHWEYDSIYGSIAGHEIAIKVFNYQYKTH